MLSQNRYFRKHQNIRGVHQRQRRQQRQNLDRCSVHFPRGFLQPLQRKIRDIILPARGQS